MAFVLETTPQFDAELADAVRYIRDVLQNPIAANNLLAALEREASSIAAFPRATLPFTVGAVAYYHVAVKNYLAFYVVRRDTVEFRRFLYARSNVTAKFK